VNRRRTVLAGALAPVLAAAGAALLPGTSRAGAARPADGAAALALLQQRLQVTPVLRGDFEQRRTLAGFRNPVVSRGEFVVARDRGVWWHTREPFDSTLVVTRTRLLTRRADGQAGTRIDAADEPGVRVVNELVFALLSADLAALAERFELAGEAVGAAGWRLQLVPREPLLARFIARATLEGERTVQKVRIEEAAGDVSEIRFTHPVPAAALAASEAARFD